MLGPTLCCLPSVTNGVVEIFRDIRVSIGLWVQLALGSLLGRLVIRGAAELDDIGAVQSLEELLLFLECFLISFDLLNFSVQLFLKCLIRVTVRFLWVDSPPLVKLPWLVSRQERTSIFLNNSQQEKAGIQRMYS